MSRLLSIMVVDDEKTERESLLRWFKEEGHTVETARSAFEALEKLARCHFHLLLIDSGIPQMDGLALLQKVKANYPETLVIITTACGSIETAVEAMKLGASDYLLKPFKPDRLSLIMETISRQIQTAREMNYLKRRHSEITRFDNIIGRSAPMQKIFDLILQVAQSDTTVLLKGETGTGKELVAKAIHVKSKRAYAPFIAINCGAIPDSLLESELFGHQKGAFTGAEHTRKGFLEVVSGGSLFLDEVGEISLKMQVDLMRVLETKQITRIGSSEIIPVDFRLISATGQDLEKDIRAGRFREDFFYRINVITIEMPPLRERKEDIPLLLAHFLEKYSRETAKRVDRISDEALAQLKAYDWPGNVRELENAVERGVVLAKSRTLTMEDFAFLRPAGPTPGEARSLRAMEIAHIKRILVECNGNITLAAKVLEINRVTLHKKLKRFGLQRSCND